MPKNGYHVINFRVYLLELQVMNLYCAIRKMVFATMKHETYKLLRLVIFSLNSTYDPNTVTAGMSRMLKVTAMHAL